MKEMADIRKNEIGLMPYLRPDSKAQVTIEYGDDNQPKRVHTIVISTQRTMILTKSKPCLTKSEKM